MEHLKDILHQGQLYLYKMLFSAWSWVHIINYSIIVKKHKDLIKYLYQILSKSLSNVIFCILSLEFD